MIKAPRKWGASFLWLLITMISQYQVSHEFFHYLS